MAFYNHQPSPPSSLQRALMNASAKRPREENIFEEGDDGAPLHQSMKRLRVNAPSPVTTVQMFSSSHYQDHFGSKIAAEYPFQTSPPPPNFPPTTFAHHNGFQESHHQMHFHKQPPRPIPTLQYNEQQTNISQQRHQPRHGGFAESHRHDFRPPQQEQQHVPPQQQQQQHQHAGQTSEESTSVSSMNKLLGSLHHQRRRQRDNHSKPVMKLATNSKLY